MRVRIITNVLICILLLFWGLTAVSAQTLSDDPLHDKAVKLAREGDNQQGLSILQSILDKDPENYAVRRDLIIIATWAENCGLALKNYQLIKDAPNQEAYLLVAVSDCLNETNRRSEAIALLEKGRAQWPEDEELEQKLAELNNEQQSETAPKVSVSLSSNNSDQGNLEWLLETRYSQQLLKDTRGYARFLAARANDPEFATGDLNRLGAGITHHLNFRWTFDVMVSTDVTESGEEGLTGTVFFQPHELWELSAQHATYAEDLPLRAKATDTTSDRSSFSADFHTQDYQWTWSAGVSMYDFSDGNKRKSYSTAGDYAYYLQPKLEHRLALDLYRATNTLPATNVVYYNPSRETSITLTHKTTVVFNTRFVRHVDNYYAYIGNYAQEGYGGEAIYGVGVQQEYQFTDNDYFTWEGGLGSRVYDGKREQQASISVSYEHTF